MTTPKENKLRKIIFYDGECGICSELIHFMIKHDKKGELYFAPLQGKTAQNRFGGLLDLSTLRFTEGSKTFDRSTAVLRAVAAMGSPWRLAKVLLVIPKGLRDFCYDRFAANRHRLSSACRIPSTLERQRFLE